MFGTIFNASDVMYIIDRVEYVDCWYTHGTLIVVFISSINWANWVFLNLKSRILGNIFLFFCLLLSEKVQKSKWVLIVEPKIPQIPQNLFGQSIQLAQKFGILLIKRMSVSVKVLLWK